MKQLECCVQGQGHNKTSKCYWTVNVYLDCIFWTAEPFTAKVDVMMHHHEPEYLSKRLFCCFEDQGHCESSYNQNMTFYFIF